MDSLSVGGRDATVSLSHRSTCQCYPCNLLFLSHTLSYGVRLHTCRQPSSKPQHASHRRPRPFPWIISYLSCKWDCGSLLEYGFQLCISQRTMEIQKRNDGANWLWGNDKSNEGKKKGEIWPIISFFLGVCQIWIFLFTSVGSGDHNLNMFTTRLGRVTRIIKRRRGFSSRLFILLLMKGIALIGSSGTASPPRSLVAPHETDREKKTKTAQGSADHSSVTKHTAVETTAYANQYSNGKVLQINYTAANSTAAARCNKAISRQYSTVQNISPTSAA